MSCMKLLLEKFVSFPFFGSLQELVLPRRCFFLKHLEQFSSRQAIPFQLEYISRVDKHVSDYQTPGHFSALMLQKVPVLNTEFVQGILLLADSVQGFSQLLLLLSLEVLLGLKQWL